MLPVALTIAGSDPSGGAGLQADLKIFHQFKVYGAAAVTLVTVQNTQAVSRVETMAADLVRAQIEAVTGDLPVKAAKSGALGNTEIVLALAELATQFSFPLVVDPVMISKHGAPLLSAAAQEGLRESLLPQAFLITPNIPEAEILAGFPISSADDMLHAAQKIRDSGCPSVLIKGGHRAGDPNDLLLHGNESVWFPGSRVQTKHTHGTGCTYSAAITACLATGLGLVESVERAKRYVQAAVETAPGLGGGHGPVNHFASAG